MTDHDARGSSPPWAELPADALSEIAGHLHDAGDFVRFRAVCRPWREALPPPRAPSFLPWIVEAYDSSIDDLRVLLPWVVESYASTGDPHVLLHSPFSTRKTRHLPPLAALRGMKIQGSDTSSGRVLAVGCSDEGRTVALINPLDGDGTSLPLLADSVPGRTRGKWWRSASGLVSSNGVVVFHTDDDPFDDLAAILLRPGEPGWEEGDVTCPAGVETRYLYRDKRRAAALWSAAALPGVACGVVTLPLRPHASDRYVLDFRGELVIVDIVIPQKYELAGVPPRSVFFQIHTMQVEDDGWHRWVEREHGRGDTITDHLCFFLGRKSSFAIDAREFAGSAEVTLTGGCAYFFYWHPKCTESEQIDGVYRYCFRSGTVTVVDELPTIIIPMWFMPRPRISPLLPRVQ
ncbi:hypothetical protein C2845_PM02G28720 [Panicum miliaceum]|uniref:KIB1-4 beta-propeller domain-containing protein n=1 Tax=Panicum miliaceum TaxID=4540 RepID=A0A3L6SA90_PANMI|nr:hypothetical protein C2845_PM02G28720 [Panicum miliaceum]